LLSKRGGGDGRSRRRRKELKAAAALFKKYIGDVVLSGDHPKKDLALMATSFGKTVDKTCPNITNMSICFF
jgi:hypothetical protein